MLYVAEVALRTTKPLQLAGLAEKYLGNIGSWLVFAGVFVNGFGAIIAYAAGSGSILAELGIPAWLGSILFYIPGAAVIWLASRPPAAPNTPSPSPCSPSSSACASGRSSVPASTSTTSCSCTPTTSCR